MLCFLFLLLISRQMLRNNNLRPRLCEPFCQCASENNIALFFLRVQTQLIPPRGGRVPAQAIYFPQNSYNFGSRLVSGHILFCLDTRKACSVQCKVYFCFLSNIDKYGENLIFWKLICKCILTHEIGKKNQTNIKITWWRLTLVYCYVDDVTLAKVTHFNWVLSLQCVYSTSVKIFLFVKISIIQF